MPSDKVLSSGEAHQEIAKMMTLATHQFPALIKQLNGHGQLLSDPNHWDGPLAQRFRGEVWPQVHSDMEKMRGSLEHLQQQVQKILAAISRAGGA